MNHLKQLRRDLAVENMTEEELTTLLQILYYNIYPVLAKLSPQMKEVLDKIMKRLYPKRVSKKITFVDLLADGLREFRVRSEEVSKEEYENIKECETIIRTVMQQWVPKNIIDFLNKILSDHTGFSDRKHLSPLKVALRVRNKLKREILPIPDEEKFESFFRKGWFSGKQFQELVKSIIKENTDYEYTIECEESFSRVPLVETGTTFQDATLRIKFFRKNPSGSAINVRGIAIFFKIQRYSSFQYIEQATFDIRTYFSKTTKEWTGGHEDEIREIGEQTKTYWIDSALEDDGIKNITLKEFKDMMQDVIKQTVLPDTWAEISIPQGFSETKL